MSLNHQDVQELLRLLDESAYDELTLKTEHFTLHLQRSAQGGWEQSTRHAATAAIAAAPAAAGDAQEQAEEPPPSEEGLIDVRAPMVGTWYRAPKPGAEPFVDVGTPVTPDTVVGIVEVMKLMNSIPAGVSGTVVELLAPDAAFVAKGQLLLRVRPEPS